MDLNILNDAYPDIWKLIVRLLCAVVCGLIIGSERKARSKEAGPRTHAIVCFASALMMIISKYAFTDINGSYDVERIAAQIVTGIGFLGAGMIFYKRDIIQGLTTAAGIWATAGIGMAIGSGMIIIGIVSTVIILLIQVFLHIRVINKSNNPNMSVTMKAILKIENNSDIEEFKEIFGINTFLKYRTFTTNSTNQPRIELEFHTKKDCSPESIYEITFNHPYIVSLEVLED